jgi:GcrA cell cycle regulator
MDFTDLEIAEVRALWAEGHSTAEIGRRLGRSKNSVVGKSHRLCLPLRPSPIKRFSGAALLVPVVVSDSMTANVQPTNEEVAEAIAKDLRNRRKWVSWFNRLPDESRKAVTGASHADGCRTLDGGGLWTCTCGAAWQKRTASEPAPRARTAVAVVPPQVVAVAAVVVFKPRSAQTCVWPSGDHPIRFVCEGMAVDGPYCAEHARRAFVRRRDQPAADGNAAA